MARGITDTRLQALRTMPYADYLRTPEWRRRRDRALARALWVCEWPGCGARDFLDVHHRTYAHRGDELDHELMVVCRRHHTDIHEDYAILRGTCLRVIRRVLGQGGHASIADFADAVKQELGTLHIRIEPRQFDTILGLVTSELNLAPRRVRTTIRIATIVDEAVDHGEACALLASIQARTKQAITLRTIAPVVVSDPEQAARDEAEARQRAAEMGITL